MSSGFIGRRTDLFHDKIRSQLVRAASTLVRVSAQFDATRSSAFIDQARLDRLVKATDGSQDDSRADAVAKLALALHERGTSPVQETALSFDE